MVTTVAVTPSMRRGLSTAYCAEIDRIALSFQERRILGLPGLVVRSFEAFCRHAVGKGCNSISDCIHFLADRCSEGARWPIKPSWICQILHGQLLKPVAQTTAYILRGFGFTEQQVHSLTDIVQTTSTVTVVNHAIGLAMDLGLVKDPPKRSRRQVQPPAEIPDSLRHTLRFQAYALAVGGELRAHIIDYSGLVALEARAQDDPAALVERGLERLAEDTHLEAALIQMFWERDDIYPRPEVVRAVHKQLQRVLPNKTNRRLNELREAAGM